MPRISGPSPKGPIEPSHGPQLDYPEPTTTLPKTAKQPKVDPKELAQAREILAKHAQASTALKEILETCKSNSGGVIALLATSNHQIIEAARHMSSTEKAELVRLLGLFIAQPIKQSPLTRG